MGDVNISPSQLTTLKNLTTICSALSTVAAAIVIVYNLISRSRRKFPSRMATYYSIASGLFTLTICLGAINDYSHLFNTRLCKLQGFFFQYFALCMIFWYTLIYFTLYSITAKHSNFITVRSYEIKFHIIGWCIPLIPCIAAVADDKFGFESSLFWCWLGASSTSTYWKFCTLYGALGVSLIFAVIWLIRIIRSMMTIHQSSKIVRDYMCRHCTFVLIITIVFIQVFSWGVNYELYTRAESSLDYWYAVCEVLAVTGLGIPLCIVFGPRPQQIIEYCMKGPQLTKGEGEGSSEEDNVKYENLDDPREINH